MNRVFGILNNPILIPESFDFDEMAKNLDTISIMLFIEEYLRKCAEIQYKILLEYRSVPLDRTSPLLAEWRDSVYSRDNWICQECGDRTGGYLHAHHIWFWKHYPEMRFELTNGVTLCKKCHTDWHRKYGYGQTKKVSEEIIRKYQRKWRKEI